MSLIWLDNMEVDLRTHSKEPTAGLDLLTLRSEKLVAVISSTTGLKKCSTEQRPNERDRLPVK
jgi:hypothetical protein